MREGRNYTNHILYLQITTQLKYVTLYFLDFVKRLTEAHKLVVQKIWLFRLKTEKKSKLHIVKYKISKNLNNSIAFL